jgi:HK97 family phage portal protein
MAISLIDWFKAHFGKGATPAEMEALYSDPDNVCAMAKAAKEMALLTCTQLITASLSKCEFQTFDKGNPKKRSEWRLWNIEPNKNQNAQDFRARLIYKLISTGDALVVGTDDGSIYIADSYTRDDSVMREALYSDVAIDNVSMNRRFNEREVMHFILPNSGWLKTFDSVADAYAVVINSGVKGYRRAQGMKGTLSIDALMLNNDKVKKAYEALKAAGFKQFADAESAVLQLYKGMEYNDVSQKTYSNQNSRDIRAMVDDLTDFAARMLGIPPVLVNGSVQDTSSAMRKYVGDCLVPLTEVIRCEINRKRYTAGDIERGTMLVIDTTQAIYVDWLTAASGIDKLVASGALSVNEVRVLLRLPTIDEEWANKHYLTKNYGDIENPGEEVIINE